MNIPKDDFKRLMEKHKGNKESLAKALWICVATVDRIAKRHGLKFQYQTKTLKKNGEISKDRFKRIMEKNGYNRELVAKALGLSCYGGVDHYARKFGFKFINKKFKSVSKEEFMSAFNQSWGRRTKTADALGISLHYVDVYAKKFGVKFTTRRLEPVLEEEFMSVFSTTGGERIQTAYYLGVSRYCVDEYAKRFGVKLKNKNKKITEEDFVKALKTTGGRISSVANVLGVSVDSVRYHARRFGVIFTGKTAIKTPNHERRLSGNKFRVVTEDEFRQAMEKGQGIKSNVATVLKTTAYCVDQHAKKFGVKFKRGKRGKVLVPEAKFREAVKTAKGMAIDVANALCITMHSADFNAKKLGIKLIRVNPKLLQFHESLKEYFSHVSFEQVKDILQTLNPQELERLNAIRVKRGDTPYIF